MPRLERACLALSLVPIGLGAVIAAFGARPLEWLFQTGLDAQPTALSNLRFLGGCFAGLGVALFVASRDARRFAPILIAGGCGLLAGFLGRLGSLALDGRPVTIALVLAIAELTSGVAFLILGRRGLRAPA